MAEQLKEKAVNGAFWTFIQRFSTILIQFVSGIILARLLSPEDFGCIGMLTIFMMLASTFLDGGFGAALIQKKIPTQADYSTIFYWSLGVSVFLYALLFLTAPFISVYYKIDILCQVLRVQGIVLIINALQLIHVNKLTKEFRFKIISLATLISSIVSLLATVTMAYYGMGVWSLVAQNILVALVPTIIYWRVTDWRPSFIFSKQSFKELFNFGFYMFLTNIIQTFVNNVQGLLIGRLYNSATMGYYSKAQGTEMLASTSLSQVITQVSYPMYAELQDEKERLINSIKKLTQIVAYITFPIMFILMLLAKPIFILLYSAKWIPAVPYFQVLCMAGLAICLQSVNVQSIAAIGKSKVMLKWGAIKQIGGLCLMLLGLYLWGLVGLLVGMVLKSWLIYLINASLVSYHIGYKLWRQLLDLFPIMAMAVISLIIAYSLGQVFVINMYVDGCVMFIVYVITYCIFSLLFKVDSAKLLIGMIKSRVKK